MPRLLEHQGKELLMKFGISVPRGKVVDSLEEAVEAAMEIGYPVVVKVQVKTGGRGKAGGIRAAGNSEELQVAVKDLLGATFKGFLVEKVLIEEKKEIAESDELYLAVFSDPISRMPKIILVRQGGVEVESYLETGEGVFTKEINILRGLKEYEVRYLCRKAGFNKDQTKILIKTAMGLYQLYRQLDCTIVEVNPLIISGNSVEALDSKINIDDDSVFKHKNLEYLDIETGEEVGDRAPTKLEMIAGKIDEGDHRGSAHFVQIDPDGSIAKNLEKVPIGYDGIGTGVSLTAMDELVQLGFYPVNFCDTSGNPTASKLYRITRVILAQEGIKGYVFVSCLSSQQLDNTARGLVKAFKEIFKDTGGHPPIPCIFSFRGAWDDVAIKLFEDHGLLESPLIKVLGRDSTERSIAVEFAEMFQEWERGIC